MKDWIPDILIIIFIDRKSTAIDCREIFVRHEGAPNLSLFAVIYSKQSSSLHSIFGFFEFFNQFLDFIQVVLGILFAKSISVPKVWLLNLELVLLFLLNVLHLIYKHLEFNALVKFEVF